jgi:hypothetical protein
MLRGLNDANRYAVEQMRLLRRFIEVLDGWPAELQAFDFRHELFGCWSIVVRRGSQRTRFTFDGKDCYLCRRGFSRIPVTSRNLQKGLSGMSLAHGVTDDSLTTVIEFIRRHTS